MKKLLALMLTVSMLFCTVSVGAEEIAESTNIIDEDIIMCIEEFFYVYEDEDAADNIELTMNQIKNVAVNEEIINYNIYNSALICESEVRHTYGESYLNMVELLLQRKKIINETTDIDLKEYGKELFFNISYVYVDESSAEVEVTVLKTWNYAFSPECESAAEDVYIIDLEKENDKWKIANISGMTQAIVDGKLGRNG